MLFFSSCNEQLEVSESEFEFSKVTIPSHLKSTLKIASETFVDEMDVKVITEDGREIIGKMRFEIPLGDEEKLVDLEITTNLLTDTELTEDFFVNYDDSNNLKATMGIGACLKNCNGIEKGDGRGWCKAGCWGELALKAATVVVAIAAL
jgi:hypothetical protein